MWRNARDNVYFEVSYFEVHSVSRGVQVQPNTQQRRQVRTHVAVTLDETANLTSPCSLAGTKMCNNATTCVRNMRTSLRLLTRDDCYDIHSRLDVSTELSAQTPRNVLFQVLYSVKSSAGNNHSFDTLQGKVRKHWMFD